jgi:hypothetical protein
VTWRRLGAADGTAQPAEAHNLSNSGIGLVVSTPLPRGALLLVQLQTPAERFASPLLVRVRHEAEEAGGRFRIGCSFAKKLSAAELQAAAPAADAPPSPGTGPAAGRLAADGGPAATAPRKERRASPRRAGSHTPVFIATLGPRPLTLDGTIFDRSRGGLCLLAPRAFAAGTVLQVRLGRDEAASPSALVRVQRCRARKKGWEVGCEFLESTSASARLLFG